MNNQLAIHGGVPARTRKNPPVFPGGNNDTGYPFTLSERRYDREMCPKTLDLLERMIHVEICQLLTGEDMDEIIAGLQKVLRQLA